MGQQRDLLDARVAAALTLRGFDAQCREMGLTSMAGRAAQERRFITDTLNALGGVPWPYNPTEDNSWIP